MSAFGPAVFVSRVDGNGLEHGERELLVASAREATVRLGLKDEDGKPARPREHGYDGGTLAILLHSGYAYRMMPPEIQRDQDEVWVAEGERVAAALERVAPGRYTFVAYGVED
ncbi:hypothetical protein [Actinoplanes solisilvae]|uniref:hypothetical protein n=1 Tax=Actinoplanes solisilvae TaxID=2486853 RepID=UPI000FD99A2D|nr:hypothetical protein [Actinoplanes solisilvae]